MAGCAAQVSQVMGQGEAQTQTDTFYSTGLDLSFVVNFVRLRTAFELGIRTIYTDNGINRQWLIQPLVIDIGF